MLPGFPTDSLDVDTVCQGRGEKRKEKEKKEKKGKETSS
jgi:hypothetical protein